MGCLGDSSVFRYVSGLLSECERAQAEQEIASCRHCAAVVAELMRDSTTGNLEPSIEIPCCNTSLPDGENHRDRCEPLVRYLLGPVIARGGMGTIVAAFDRRLDRTVVVKLMDRTTPLLMARFEREIRVTALLQHPGIVPIYDAGAMPDGQLFYAMRHVAGASLEQAMQRCAGEPDRLALLGSVIATADAVAYAHERGVIHRDLKPSNIMVGPFGETIVIDWGLAAVGDAAAPELSVPGSDQGHDAVMTRHGAVMGTPRYMAPEQARGEPATRQSDVYALGAILYHTLSGAPPILGQDASAVLDRAARAEVQPLRAIAPRLPDDLAAIVERAMAADPALRYATAGELAADLRRFQTGQLVGAHRYSRRALVWRTVRRHRAAFALAAALAVVVIGGGTLSVRSIVREGEHAQQEWNRAEHERGGAEDLVQFLLSDQREKLTALGRLDIMAGVADRVEAYYLTTAAGRADSPHALRDRAALEALRAAIAAGTDDSARADRYIERGLQLLDRAPATAEADDTRATLLQYKAQRAAQTGDFERTRALSLEAIALLRRGARSGSPEQQRHRSMKLARLLSSAATDADRLGRPGDADRERTEAIALLEQRMTEEPGSTELAKLLGRVKLAAGQGWLYRGLLDDSEAALRAALAAEDRLSPDQRKDSEVQYVVAYANLALAEVRNDKGDRAGSRPFDERALATASAMQAIEPANASWQMTQARAEAHLGAVALQSSAWAVAAPHLAAARLATEQLLTRDASNRDYRRLAAVATAQLADAEAGLGRFDAARNAWLGAIGHLEVLARSNAPTSRLELAYGLRGYAEFERTHGRLAAAEPAIQRAVELADQTPVQTDRPVMSYYRAAILAELAAEQAQRGQPRDASAAWHRAGELLHGVAERVPLQQDWAELLATVDAHLGRQASRSAVSAGRR